MSIGIFGGNASGGGGGGGLVTQGTNPWIVATADTTATGTLTVAGQTVELSCDGLAVVGIDVSSPAATATYRAEGTIDDLVWTPIQVNDSANWNSILAQAVNAGGVDWFAAASGWKKIRLRYVSGAGTLTVILRGNKTSNANFLMPVQQGTGSGATGSSTSVIPWSVRIFGTSGVPAEASAAGLYTVPAVAVAADQALVNFAQDNVYMDLLGNTRTIMNNWLGSKAPTVGQKAMASSLPVVVASDQSAIPVSQSGTWNITNISGTISLPTGAATAARQDTGNTSLASILGQLDVALSTRLKPADTLTAVTTVGTITNVVHVDDNAGSITVDGPLTDTQLRATAVPVSGPVTDTQLRASDVNVAAKALVTDINFALTASTSNQISQTSTGRLRVDVENDVVNRRLAEQALLNAYTQTLQQMIAAEWGSSHRMGFELR